DHRSHDIRALHGAIRGAIQGKARPPSGLKQVGNWVLQEKLTADSWRGTHAFAGGSPVLVRFYSADPYLPEGERKQQVSRIANAYKALSALPSHPGIVAVRDFTPTEAEDRFALVTEDPVGQALRPRLRDTRAPLTFDQKVRIARDLLGALAHAHAHSVVHRNLHPGTILVCDDGQTRLSGFDYARAGKDRSSTIAELIVDELDETYQAPECFADPGAASPASDVFSAGVVVYELFAGEPPFADAAEIEGQHAVFAEPPSAREPALPAGCDAWLQSLCAFDAGDRPAALDALGTFERLLGRTAERNPAVTSTPGVDYRDLPAGHPLTSKYVVQERLGEPGGFGVAYRVIDTLGDVSRVVKLVLQDRYSKLDRLKKEYRILLGLPAHPRVVKVVNADILPGEDGPPYIVFEYIEGQDVGEMIASDSLSTTDAWELGRQVTEGLVHLHASGVYHGDIKPRNLLWTDDGARIIDFNVSTRSGDDGHGGGSRRYLVPDLDTSHEPTDAERAERDVYALGITLYEALTGEYPWQTKLPPPAKLAKDPRKCARAAALSSSATELLLKALAPKRAERFASARELLEALDATAVLRPKAPQAEESSTWTVPELGVPQPNTNPFVSYLLTLYSQGRCNCGTRGLDALGERTYVETALDRDLLPAVLAGEFGLVIITGNAGDGKTAFLQRVETGARERGADVLAAASGNGASFELDG
ncbi:MAG: protein kinase, partial [Victivallales bacterium]|nr:protein kinase [Victivallales bacterium]